MTLNDSITLQRKVDQVKEALSPRNRWIAGINLGHEPTEAEAVLWYIEHGGAEAYAETHPDSEDFSGRPRS